MAQMLERYVYKNQKKMRCGYTTGTCAAAAAKAAAQMLLSGRKVTEVSVRTPSDITLTLPVCEIQMKAHAVSCAVQKDSGDDPDITNKILIFAEVSYIHNNSNMNKSTDMTVKKCDTELERSDTAAVKPQMIVDGGVGIGRITKKGLARPVGAAAINPVPLKMIEAALKETAEAFGYEGGLQAVISAPQGVEIAKKTFNPQLGITGGISILGTSGIVEPMSEQALISSIAPGEALGLYAVVTIPQYFESQELVNEVTVISDETGTTNMKSRSEVTVKSAEVTVTPQITQTYSSYQSYGSGSKSGSAYETASKPSTGDDTKGTFFLALCMCAVIVGAAAAKKQR